MVKIETPISEIPKIKKRVKINLKEDRTVDPLPLLQSLDNQIQGLKDGFIDHILTGANDKEFKDVFFFHIRKLEWIVGDFADLYDAKKKYVKRQKESKGTIWK